MPRLDRLRLAAYAPCCVVAVGLVLRPLLYAAFHAGSFSARDLLWSVAAGVVFDVLVGVAAATPLTLALAAFRLRALERKVVRFALFAGIGAFVTFGAFVEWFFFDEFNSRFNNIAIDYIRNPKEVVGNIHESYRVGLFIGLALAAGALLGALGVAATRGLALDAPGRRVRLKRVAFALLASALAIGVLEALPSEVSDDRIVSEVAQNGLDRLVHAVRTGSLDYRVYYRMLPLDLARRRAAVVLDAPWIAHRAESRDAGTAALTGADGSPRRWDVVVILEESLGSEFIGALGHSERKTSPGFDRWSREGLLLTNLTATGNRTVRGLEGTLCSMVPLPSAAVLKRMSHDQVATLADVFKADGYETTFVYGGWGRFDDMKPFFPTNGFDEFIERGSFPSDALSTIWGVADEWSFAAALEKQKDAARRGQPVFMTLLTVSNHRPFLVPERGTAWPAVQHSREAAVAYADWALADYLDKAKAAGLLDHTLVLVEGDHGARVYGSEEIPTASYRIPGLFLVPGDAWRGRRIDRLASQIDLAPTLLALMGRSSPIPFLGEDLTRRPASGGRAFVHHNRDVGLLTDRALVTLGLQREDVCYTRDGRDSDVFTRAPSCSSSPELQALEDDAASVFEVADDMLRTGSYRIDPLTAAIASHRRTLPY